MVVGMACNYINWSVALVLSRAKIYIAGASRRNANPRASANSGPKYSTLMTNNFLFCKCIYNLCIGSDDGISGESNLGVVDVVVFAWAGERRKNKRSTSDCHVRRDI